MLLLRKKFFMDAIKEHYFTFFTILITVESAFLFFAIPQTSNTIKSTKNLINENIFNILYGSLRKAQKYLFIVLILQIIHLVLSILFIGYLNDNSVICLLFIGIVFFALFAGFSLELVEFVLKTNFNDIDRVLMDDLYRKINQTIEEIENKIKSPS